MSGVVTHMFEGCGCGVFPAVVEEVVTEMFLDDFGGGIEWVVVDVEEKGCWHALGVCVFWRWVEVSVFVTTDAGLEEGADFGGVVSAFKEAIVEILEVLTALRAVGSETKDAEYHACDEAVEDARWVS